MCPATILKFIKLPTGLDHIHISRCVSIIRDAICVHIINYKHGEEGINWSVNMKMSKEGNDWIILTLGIVSVLWQDQILFIIARILKLGKYIVNCTGII
jgi:hypothetical protein